LSTFQKSILPHSLLQKLDSERLVPTWLSELELDLDRFHEIFTRGWPQTVKNLEMSVQVAGPELGALDGSTIRLPLSSVVSLRRLTAEMNRAFVRPADAEPAAQLQTTRAHLAAAAEGLRWLAAMMAETGFVGWPDDKPLGLPLKPHGEGGKIWIPSVMMGVRFLYYHELAHAALHSLKLPQRPDLSSDIPEGVLDGEERFEVEADRLGWILAELETRSVSNLSVFAGIIALAAVALKEIGATPRQPHWNRARTRMDFLLSYVARHVEAAPTAEELVALKSRLAMGLAYRELLGRLFDLATDMGCLPSPVDEVLRGLEDPAPNGVDVAIGLFPLWLAFGDRRALRSSLGASLVRLDESRRKRVLRSLQVVSTRLAGFEPQLGLSMMLNSL
jgi:hypothetical protein